MFKRIYLIIALLLCACSHSQANDLNVSNISLGNILLPGGTPKLLTMGDSNTAGFGPSNQFAYRKQMQIVAPGYNLVGDFQNPASDPTYDVDHSGVFGETASQIVTRLSNDLPQYFGSYVIGDTVILNGGTNNALATSGQRTATVNDIKAGIDLVQAFNTTNNRNVKILVTTIVPTATGATPTPGDVNLYNIELKSMVATESSDPNVILVDWWSVISNDTRGVCGGNYAVNCMTDGLHLNLTGYNIVGQVTGESLNNCLATPECIP